MAEERQRADWEFDLATPSPPLNSAPASNRRGADLRRDPNLSKSYDLLEEHNQVRSVEARIAQKQLQRIANEMDDNNTYSSAVIDYLKDIIDSTKEGDSAVARKTLKTIMSQLDVQKDLLKTNENAAVVNQSQLKFLENSTRFTQEYLDQQKGTDEELERLTALLPATYAIGKFFRDTKGMKMGQRIGAAVGKTKDFMTGGMEGGAGAKQAFKRILGVGLMGLGAMTESAFPLVAGAALHSQVSSVHEKVRERQAEGAAPGIELAKKSITDANEELSRDQKIPRQKTPMGEIVPGGIMPDPYYEDDEDDVEDSTEKAIRDTLLSQEERAKDLELSQPDPDLVPELLEGIDEKVEMTNQLLRELAGIQGEPKDEGLVGEMAETAIGAAIGSSAASAVAAGLATILGSAAFLAAITVPLAGAVGLGLGTLVQKWVDKKEAKENAAQGATIEEATKFGKEGKAEDVEKRVEQLKKEIVLEQAKYEQMSFDASGESVSRKEELLNFKKEELKALQEGINAKNVEVVRPTTSMSPETPIDIGDRATETVKDYQNSVPFQVANEIEKQKQAEKAQQMAVLHQSNNTSKTSAPASTVSPTISTSDKTNFGMGAWFMHSPR